MSRWKKTGCVLCGQNCGLEVLVKNNRIIKVRPGKENPRIEGYACRTDWEKSLPLRKYCMSQPVFIHVYAV